MNEKIRRVRAAIAAGAYDERTLEGELALHLAADRVLAFLTESTSRGCGDRSGGAAHAAETDSP